MMTQLSVRGQTLLAAFFGLCTVLGFLLMLPIGTVWFFPEERSLMGPFLVPAVVLIVGGFSLRSVLLPAEDANLTVPDGMMLAVLTWLTAIVASAIPLALIQDMSWPQAIFEATSGWTTCGLTVISVDEAPRIILFFRSLMQYIGGVGFVLLSVLALASPADRSILVAEGSDSYFVGDARHTTGILLAMYLVYTVMGILAYLLVGLSPFDALNHAMTAVSTGGFSTQVGSIGAFDSLPVEGVTLVLMILGAVNFSTAFMLMRGRLRIFFDNAEIRVTMVLLPVSIALVFFSGTNLVYNDMPEALRNAVFEATSALTGTGFTISDLSVWTPASLLVLIVLMSIGGGTGSTTGGLKQNRVYGLFLRLRYQIRLLYHGGGDPDLPDPVMPAPTVREGEHRARVDARDGSRAGTLVLAYMGLLLLCTFIMATFGFSLQDALFESSSTLGTVGLTVGVTSSDHPLLLLVQSVMMLLGRLEVFAVLIGVAHLAAIISRTVRRSASSHPDHQTTG